MLRSALCLLLALAPALARAACPDVPPAEGSTDRALSDVPYDTRPQPCPTPDQAGMQSKASTEGWTAPTSNYEMTPTRAGLMITALGSMLLVSGVSFAICARHGPDESRSFCRDARAPVLIAGGAIAAIGLGTLGVGALIDREPAPSGRTAWRAGLQLQVALATDR